MAGDRLCIGCGIVIDRPFWLCQTCEDDVGVAGVDYADWPEYLKYLALDAQREERSLDNDAISLDAFEEWIGEMLEPPDDDALMAYAPYADEAANEVYRKSNGIKPRPSG